MRRHAAATYTAFRRLSFTTLTRGLSRFSSVVPSRRLATAASGEVSSSLHGIEHNGITYPFRWLRDSCPCPECVHPSSRQKLHKTSDIPASVQPAPENGIQYTGSGVRIKWSSGHSSFYPNEMLKHHASLPSLQRYHRDMNPIAWDTNRLKSSPDLFVPYEKIQSPASLLRAITQLTQYGLVFVTGVPNEQTSNETAELRNLAQYFGEIRSTFYGELWDVKNVRNSRNIAYTNLDLGLHMDLLYFQHPPRYQFLHCLRNRVRGGTSVFVDALNAAHTLRTSHPADFATLATTPVNFHYINDGHHLHHSHPTIELAPLAFSSPSTASADEQDMREIKHINYSPPFQAPLPLSTPPAFYNALARFASLLEQRGVKYEYTLREGDVAIFDNRRVLHARTAFEDVEDINEGQQEPEVGAGRTRRWLKGCYLEADAVLDRGRVLREGLGRDV